MRLDCIGIDITIANGAACLVDMAPLGLRYSAGKAAPSPDRQAGLARSHDVRAQLYTLNSAIDHHLPELPVLTTLM